MSWIISEMSIHVTSILEAPTRKFDLKTKHINSQFCTAKFGI